jgi:hypothetical protein
MIYFSSFPRSVRVSASDRGPDGVVQQGGPACPATKVKIGASDYETPTWMFGGAGQHLCHV